MSTRGRLLLTAVVPLALAAVFARLGVWQLSRLAERRAFNTTLAARLDSAPVSVLRLNPDTGSGHYRRVSASGTYLYDREVTYAGRSRNGSPGVDLLTPMRANGSDTVVMVNRGWVYSPDARAVLAPRWRERDTASVSGYAETFAGKRGGAASAEPPNTRPQPRTVRGLDRAVIEREIGMPIAPYLLVQTSDSAPRLDSVPARLPPPALDEGPHASYAIQWFGFTLIALVGGVLLYRTQRRQTADAATERPPVA